MFAEVLAVLPLSALRSGVGAAPGEFAPLAGGYLPALHLSPAFYRTYRKYFDPTNEALAIRLRGGEAGLPTFHLHLAELRQRLQVGFDTPFEQTRQTAGVQQSTRAQAIALWVLALLVSVAGLAIFTQSLARQTFLESVEYPSLRALGFLMVFQTAIASAGVTGLSDLITVPPYLRQGATALRPRAGVSEGVPESPIG